MRIKIVSFLALSLLFSASIFGRNSSDAKLDSLPVGSNSSSSTYNFTAKQLIVPSSLILLGATGLVENWTRPSVKIQERVVNQWNNPFHTISIDDYMPYFPALAVYGLNIAGVKGKHDFVDRTIILASSAVITLATIQILKTATHNLRPDGSAYNSWPSGHTATAFACAEFLHQEYKDKSVWISVSGYTLATSVGVLRVYNNRHWLTDVVAGAGFGILGTKAAYWLFPVLKENIFTCKKAKSKSSSSLFVVPCYTSNQLGFQLAATF